MRRPEASRRWKALALFGAMLFFVGCASAPNKAGSTSAISQRSVNVAQALLDQGNAADALVESTEAVRADPRHVEARVVHATVLTALGRDDEAATQLQRAVALEPDNGAVLNAYGAWLCRNDRWDEALKVFSDATLDVSYRNPEQALANAGSCAYRAGRDRTAEINFRAALGLSPTQAQSLTGMAQLEQRRGDLLKARAFLQRREALAPLGPGELALGIEIETAAGDARAAARYRKQLADLAGPANAAGSSSGPGVPRQ